MKKQTFQNPQNALLQLTLSTSFGICSIAGYREIGNSDKEMSKPLGFIGTTIGKIAQATEEWLTNQQINALYATKEYDNNFIYELLEKNGAKIKLYY